MSPGKKQISLVVPAVLALLALSACQSDRAEHRHSDSDQAASAPAKPEPEMAAKAAFFNGTLEVDVVLNRAGFVTKGPIAPDTSSAASTPPNGSPAGAAPTGPSPAGSDALSLPTGATASASADSSSGSAANNDSGTPSSGSGRGGGHRHGGGAGGPSSGGYDDAGLKIRPANLQAVSFHLRLVNHAAFPVEVEVTDFNSDLGNFVVEPEKITLEPNESAEAEPMTSRLGVTSDAIPLTISVRYKGLEPKHQKEKQVLTLKPLAPVDAPKTWSPPPLRFN